MSAINSNQERAPAFLGINIPSPNSSATSTPKAPRTRRATFVLKPEEVSRISDNNNNHSNRNKSHFFDGHQDELLTDDDDEVKKEEDDDDEDVFQLNDTTNDPQMEADVSLREASRVLQPETLTSKAYIAAPPQSKRAVIKYMQLRKKGLLKFNGYTYARTISHVPSRVATLPPECPMPCLLPYRGPNEEHQQQAKTPLGQRPKKQSITLKAPVKRLQHRSFIKSLFVDGHKRIRHPVRRNVPLGDRPGFRMAIMLLTASFSVGTFFGALLSSCFDCS